MKIAIIARDFFPFDRPSGATSYLAQVVDALVKLNIKVKVMSVRKKGQSAKYYYKSVPIVKFNNTDLIRLKSEVDSFEPDKVLLFSSISSGNLLWIWWLIITITLGKWQMYLYQVTNMVSMGEPALIKLIISRIDGMFVTNDFLRKVFKNEKIFVKTIYPGVDTSSEVFENKAKSKISSVGYFGHMSQIKGVDVFVEVAEKLPDIKFYLVAGASKRKSDVEFANMIVRRAEKLKNIKVYGFVDSPLEIMSNCDLLLLPYRDAGSILGISQSGIESLAMSIPVAGTKNQALEPLIEELDDRLYAANAVEFVGIIRRINKKSELEELSKKARALAREKFDVTDNTQRIVREMYGKPI